MTTTKLLLLVILLPLAHQKMADFGILAVSTAPEFVTIKFCQVHFTFTTIIYWV